jgi:REP element-mobilizing transposase RayT
MHLSPFGEIVREEWEKTPAIRAEVTLDTYEIMPDHFHAIVIFRSAQDDSKQPHTLARSGIRYRKPRSLGSLVAGFKRITTGRINAMRNTPGKRVWQRNYWDRILYSERAMRMVRRYIRNNPARWGKPRR